MVYFFHHYELPVITQQAQLQQLIIRSRQQTQQQQQNNQRTATTPSAATATATTVAAALQLRTSPIRRITLTNFNIPNTNQGNDNNNNQNILAALGTSIRQNIRLLNIFRTVRNVLWNGIINPNNINTPRIRMVDLRNNLRQINLGGIEIRPSLNNANDNIATNTSVDTRSTFQRNYDENNFRVENSDEIVTNNGHSTTTMESTLPDSASTPNTVNNATTDISNEPEVVGKEQTIKTDEISSSTVVADTKEIMDGNIDEYSFEIIENKHRN